MRDQLLILQVPHAGLRLCVCTATLLARDAASRHQLGSGSAATLGQALAGSLLVAATEGSRVDVQLECGGPLRGLLADAESSGEVRGLVRVNELDRAGAPAAETSEGPLTRFDARPLLSSAHDEKAGTLSILRASAGMQSPHRTAFPFAGGDLGAALTLFLRSERSRGGEMALEVLFGEGEPLACVGGVLIDGEGAQPLGKPVRQGKLHEALLRAKGSAHALAHELADLLGLGPLELTTELQPRFQCRCSRDRVVRALKTLGTDELRDMATKDGGASATCDFCAATYRIPADELLSLAAATQV